jgi:YD repeat-containing protein
VPGALPGNYYIIVRTDLYNEEQEGGDESNNIVATGPIPLSVRPLATDAVPVSGTLTNMDQSDYYGVYVESGKNLAVALDRLDANGVTDFFVSYETIPTRLDYDHHSTAGALSNQQVAIGGTLTGTYYVFVYGDQLTGSSSYELTADTPEIIVTSINPDHHGVASACTMTLTGAGFDDATTVEFVGSDGSMWTATETQLISQTTMTLALEVPTWPVDVYDLIVTKPSGVAYELVDAFEVTPGIPYLETRVVAPSIVGYVWCTTVWIEYTNTGEASMPAPLLRLHGSDNAVLTLDSSLARTPGWDGSVPGTSDTVQVMATASGATPSILQPGDSGRIPVYYLGIKRPWDFSDGRVDYNLGVLTVDSNEPIDWASLKEETHPESMPTNAWNAIWANLTDQVGTTWGDYVAMLNENMDYLHTVGQDVTDTQSLWNFKLAQASVVFSSCSLANATDSFSPAPGLPLVFSRSWGQSIANRYKLGPLGRGWTHNWDIHGEGKRTDPDGTTWQFRSDGLLDYVQDRNGNRITAGYTGGLLTSLTHSNGDQILLEYNGYGRIWHVTDPRGAGVEDDHMTTFEYDASGEYLERRNSRHSTADARPVIHRIPG